jgi:ferredoxin-NADP reductase
MSHYIVKIKSIKKVTHDVLQIATEKPSGYSFIPGQATDVSINHDCWKEEKRPFTFTCLPDNDYIEFTIKTYPSHQSVTNQLLQLNMDDELILHDVFGDIAYKGEGVFIAGGAGVTPFISIFRHLQSKNEIRNNKLIFANKTKDDIILEEEFKNMLGKNFINILSDEKIDGYANGFITEDFLKANINDPSKYIYLCGPPPMMDAVEKILAHLKVNEKLIVKEAF